LSQEDKNDSRVNFLDKLLSTSTGAKQVMQSDDPEVRVLHEKAKTLLDQARKEFDKGNNKEGSTLLDESAKTMFSAIRQATPKAVYKVKEKRDYEKERTSVQALQKAYTRVSEEKNYKGKEQINTKVNDFIRTADDLSEKTEYVQAKTELDKAYQLLKISIEAIRGGETLVRSLNFATAEEEYHYELDRNDTHSMLIHLLVSDKDVSEYTQTQVDKFTSQAESLRTQAEQSALQGAFKDAILMLEQSTKQLVRAIRSAGIFIPG
jgi:hypothetical protein